MVLIKGNKKNDWSNISAAGLLLQSIPWSSCRVILPIIHAKFVTQGRFLRRHSLETRQRVETPHGPDTGCPSKTVTVEREQPNPLHHPLTKLTARTRLSGKPRRHVRLSGWRTIRGPAPAASGLAPRELAALAIHGAVLSAPTPEQRHVRQRVSMDFGVSVFWAVLVGCHERPKRITNYGVYLNTAVGVFSTLFSQSP